jgi:alpha-galactosidase/6-phospho-beta-glucosidase family protein
MKTAQKLAADPQESLTFEKVWKMFQETREQIAATDRQMKETDRQMKETDRKLGELTNRFGTMVEHLVVPNLLAKFKSLGFTFEVAHKNTEIKDERNKIFVEVDVFLENGDKAMIVEIKATPTVKDVNEHIARMEKLRKHADLRKDTRKYLGALAGVVTSEPVKTYALKKGLYVIVPSGDTFDIIKPEGKYQVKEW